MRVKYFEISYESLAWLLGPSPWQKITSDMPDDVRVLDAWIDHDRRTVRLTIESAIFDEVPEAALLQKFDPSYTRHVRHPWIEALADDLAGPKSS
jgi:hypothetical protein